MTLPARAIALQGLGFAPRFVALQGLVPVPVDVGSVLSQIFLTGGSVGGATMTLDEWRRRGQQSARAAGMQPEAVAIEAPRRQKRTKREREEEFLILLKH